MASTPVQNSTHKFLMAGGMYEMPLQMLREKGILPDGYVFHEYPKAIRVNERMEPYRRVVDTADGGKITDEGERLKWDEIVVNSPEEEERVLSGGKTSQQVEEEHQSLLMRAKTLGIHADPKWSIVRLKRELGDEMDKPLATPADEMARLEAELAMLQKIEAMKAEIASLRAKTTADDPDQMRSDLAALGIVADKRWGTARLREELERATQGEAA